MFCGLVGLTVVLDSTWLPASLVMLVFVIVEGCEIVKPKTGPTVVPEVFLGRCSRLAG